MARTRGRGLVTVVLFLLALLLGTDGTVLAAAAADTTAHGRDPYGHGGMVVPLPGGGHLRLVRPNPQPAPSAPGTGPAPAPGGGAGHGGAGHGGAGPAPGRGQGTATPSPLSVSELPVPVLAPLFPPGRPGPAASGAAAGRPAAGASPVAGTPGGAPTTGPSSPSLLTRTRHLLREDWLPLGQGPPPLGPQALAGPPAVDAVPPVAAPSPADRSRSAEAAGWERRRRLLPLGVGLALIGGGSALFGWRLRRP